MERSTSSLVILAPRLVNRWNFLPCFAVLRLILRFPSAAGLGRNGIALRVFSNACGNNVWVSEWFIGNFRNFCNCLSAFMHSDSWKSFSMFSMSNKFCWLGTKFLSDGFYKGCFFAAGTRCLFCWRELFKRDHIL